jgi:hypothetical protein
MILYISFYGSYRTFFLAPWDIFNNRMFSFYSMLTIGPTGYYVETSCETRFVLLIFY